MTPSPRALDDFHIGHHDADVLLPHPRTRSSSTRERGVPPSQPTANVPRTLAEDFSLLSTEEEHIYDSVGHRLIYNIDLDEEFLIKVGLWANLSTCINDNLGWDPFCMFGIGFYYELIIEFLSTMDWKDDEARNEFISFHVRDEKKFIMFEQLEAIFRFQPGAPIHANTFPLRV